MGTAAQMGPLSSRNGFLRLDQGRSGQIRAGWERCFRSPLLVDAGKVWGIPKLSEGKVWPKYGNMVDIFVKVHGWVLAMGHFSDFFHPRKTFQFCCEKRP